jgi:hypothetical protein
MTLLLHRGVKLLTPYQLEHLRDRDLRRIVGNVQQIVRVFRLRIAVP